MNTPSIRRFLSSLLLASAVAASADSTETAKPPRWSVGTAAWSVFNALPEPPDFWYLEVNRRLTERGHLVFEALTWNYPAPIGIPFGPSWGDESEQYANNGLVRSVGAGLGWRQEFLQRWNASLRAYHFYQIYSEDGSPDRHGYQLLLLARAGWRWGQDRTGLWIEPSITANWWPIEIGRPESFKTADDRWPSYMLFEPWLNFGWSW